MINEGYNNGYFVENISTSGYSPILIDAEFKEEKYIGNYWFRLSWKLIKYFPYPIREWYFVQLYYYNKKKGTQNIELETYIGYAKENRYL